MLSGDMTRSSAVSFALALLFMACNDAPPRAPALDQIEPVADVRQLMASILEPAADVYWDAVGSVVDSTGTKEFAPKTDAEWAAVRNSAFVLAESGNLLMLPPRARDNGEWIAFSRNLIAQAKKAIAAADARDPKAVFDVGAEVYDACTQCHAKYAVEQVRPNSQSK